MDLLRAQPVDLVRAQPEEPYRGSIPGAAFAGAAQDLRAQPKTFREAMPTDERSWISSERNGRRKVGVARTLLRKLLRESINKQLFPKIICASDLAALFCLLAGLLPPQYCREQTLVYIDV